MEIDLFTGLMHVVGSENEAQNPESKPTDFQKSVPMEIDLSTGLMQVAGRDVSSELSELDDPTPKKRAKSANKVRSE